MNHFNTTKKGEIKAAYMANDKGASIKEATNELLQTRIFQSIAQRNTASFAEKLAIWLVRYVLIISSMNESLHINLEQILMNLHGDRLRKIVEITNNSFNTAKQERDDSQNYIW